MSSPIDLGPWPPLGYAAGNIDRAAHLRGDKATLVALEQNPGAIAYIIAGDLVVLGKTGHDIVPTFTPAEARALKITGEVFLGTLQGAGCFGFWVDAADAENLKQRDDLVIMDLRAVTSQGLIADSHLDPIAEAKSLLSWHARHRFCANCGASTTITDAGWRRDCPACGTQHFPRIDPVVIMLTVDGDDCLLGRSGRFPPTMWSCLAGYIEPGETIEEAVRRETLEEAGIVCGEVRYFTSQPWPFPSSLMIGCHAQALSRDIVIDRNEIEEARWFSRREAALMLAQQHPEKLALPRPVAIAYHIIRQWVEGEIDLQPSRQRPSKTLYSGANNA